MKLKWIPKVGERVAVYEGSRGVGVISDYDESNNNYTVDLDTASAKLANQKKWYSLHRKQLRRLVKKKRRRVWISDANLAKVLGSNDGAGHVAVWNSKPLVCPVTEFIEVRK